MDHARHTRQWAQLRGLMFTASRVVEGLYPGRHPSPRRGPGLEFHDYRAYCPGDDPAGVDWKLYGRTDRYYLRRYRRFTDLPTYVLVDATASMDFAGLDGRVRGQVRGRGQPPDSDTTTLSKWRYAGTLAAAIAFLSVRWSNRVGLGVFADKLLEYLPPAGTWPGLSRLCATLEQAHPRAGGGDVGMSLKQLHTLMRRRSLVVLISDLLDEPDALFDGLDRLRHDRFEVVVFQVLHPQELSLSGLEGRGLHLTDAESGLSVHTHVRRVGSRYRRVVQDHNERLRRGCLGRGIDYRLVTTDQPPVEALRRFLTRRVSTPR